MTKIALYLESDDWQAFYIDRVLIAQGHYNKRDVMYALVEHKVDEMYDDYIEPSDDITVLFEKHRPDGVWEGIIESYPNNMNEGLWNDILKYLRKDK